MAENKKSFILYCDLIHTVSKLSDRDAGKLFKAIFQYVNDQPFELNDTIQDIFCQVINSINTEWNKFNPKTNKYHWNFKGGISPENKIIRNSVQNDLWRIKVFERDGYTCQNCFQVGGILNAHHIKEFAKYPELRFEVSNGLTLCKNCHIQIHKKEIQCQTEC